MKKLLSVLLAIMVIGSMFVCTSCGNKGTKEIDEVSITPEKVTETVLSKGGYKVTVAGVYKDGKDYVVNFDIKNKNKVGATISFVDATVNGKAVETESQSDAAAKETSTVGILVKTSDLKLKNMGELKGKLQIQEQEDWEIEYSVPITFDALVFSLL